MGRPMNLVPNGLSLLIWNWHSSDALCKASTRRYLVFHGTYWDLEVAARLITSRLNGSHKWLIQYSTFLSWIQLLIFGYDLCHWSYLVEEWFHGFVSKRVVCWFAFLEDLSREICCSKNQWTSINPLIHFVKAQQIQFFYQVLSVVSVLL